VNAYRILAGFLVAFLVGASARWFDIPVPAPPTFLGAFLIVMMTAGWIVTDKYLAVDETGREPHQEKVIESSPDNTKN
jgi:XapX domain-containing protein